MREKSFSIKFWVIVCLFGFTAAIASPISPPIVPLPNVPPPSFDQFPEPVETSAKSGIVAKKVKLNQTTLDIFAEIAKIQKTQKTVDPNLDVLRAELKKAVSKPFLHKDKDYATNFRIILQKIEAKYPNQNIALLTRFRMLNIDYEMRDLPNYYIDAQQLIDNIGNSKSIPNNLSKTYLARAYSMRANMTMSLKSSDLSFRVPVRYQGLSDVDNWVIAKADARMALKSYGIPQDKADKKYAYLVVLDKGIEAWVKATKPSINTVMIENQINASLGIDTETLDEALENRRCPTGASSGFDSAPLANGKISALWGVAYVVVDINNGALENVRIPAFNPKGKFIDLVKVGLANAKPKYLTNAPKECTKDYVILVIYISQPPRPPKK